MTLHDVLHEAAHFIETHPQHFVFSKSWLPESMDQCGCALGWIGYFSGERYPLNCYEAVQVGEVARQTLHLQETRRGEAELRFYDRVDELAGTAWKSDARACARGLRLYAEKYHGIPESVRELFAAPQACVAA